MDLDYNLLATEALTCLKKGRSLEQLARKLGVKRTTTYSWINHKSQPPWSALYSLILLNNDYPLKDRWKNYPLKTGYDLLEFFIDQSSFKEVAEASGLTVNGLKKTIYGKVTPKASTLFRVWDSFSRYHFLAFLFTVIGLRKSQWFGPIATKWEAEIKLSKNHPYFAGVIIALRNQPREKQEFIKFAAHLFGTSNSEMSEFISCLIDFNFVIEKKGWLKYGEDYFFNAGVDFPTSQFLTDYWVKKSMDWFLQQDESPQNATFNYAILQLKKEDFALIQAELNRVYSLARNLAEKDPCKSSGLISLSAQLYPISRQ